MLRAAFLPSDFHPMVLILGDGPELAQLGGLLRSFARSGNDTPLEAAQRTGSITLTGGGQPGMRPAGDSPGAYFWSLQPEQALQFAESIERLSSPDMLAGSEHLETDSPGEIPVKVSRGEYTDDFLLQE